MLEVFGTLGALLFVLAFFAMMAVLVFRNLLYICGPNEVLIFSGGNRVVEGRDVGYRVIKGGSSIRRPLIETVDRLDLTNMIIEVNVTNAYSKGGIPLTVAGVANVKVAGHEPVLNNAIERFLGWNRDAIMQVAKDTLEGNLRGVLSQLTPEQVNEDKITFAEKLLEEAEHDLTRLGLVLDTLKIQNVADEKGYLKSIGRKQSAELVTRSKIAEARARTEAIQRDAENRRNARLTSIESEMAVATAENNKRIADAVSRREAVVAEESGRVKALVARAQADLAVQSARVEQVRRQLEADVIAPAEAACRASQSEAKGNASKALEDGRATATVLQQMIDAWRKGGGSARDIFLVQKLQVLLGDLVGTIRSARIDRITVLPSDTGVSARKAVALSEELKGATGIDVPRLVEGLVSKG
ncbi:MAG: flotillin family protein [Deltaproteobacteria bacterium]|nr:flotillin family protein [Deltaproteobacteria bacterium]